MHLLFDAEWESEVFLIDTVTYKSSCFLLWLFSMAVNHVNSVWNLKKLFHFRFNIKNKKKMSNNSYRTLWRFYRIFSHVRHSVFIFVYVFFLNEIWILCMNFVFSVCGCYVLIERSSFFVFLFWLIVTFFCLFW